MIQYDLNLREYWHVVRKRKFIIIFTVIIMGLFSFAFAFLREPASLYMATASVKIEKTSSVTGLYIRSISWSQTDNMETQAAMIKSYFIMEKVAKKLGLIPRDLASEDVRASNEYLGIILKLKNSVETKQEGFSDIINIIVTSGDPAFVKRLANTIARVYREERVLDLNRRTLEAKKFIEKQLKIVKGKLRSSEEAVRDFRERNKLVSLSAQTSSLLGQMAKLQTNYEKATWNYQKVGETKKLLHRAKDKPLTSKTSFYINEASTIYKSLNEKLVQLMLQKDALLLTYTKNYPQVVEINKQIREIVTSMSAQLSSQEKVLAEDIRVLKKRIGEMDEQINELPEKGLQLARLERNVQVNMELSTLLEKNYQESLIKEAEKIEEVKIVKPALEPTHPINPPKTWASAVLGTIVGLILGIVFAFLVETFDTSIGAIEEIEEFLGIPVLGVIPHISIQEIKAALEEKHSGDVDDEAVRRGANLVSHFAPKSVLAEGYRALRTNLNFASLESDIKAVVFTSSSPEEGKTISAINLAITMAQGGNKVLLVDGDLRKPVVSRLFGIDQAPGLTDVVLGDYEWRKVVRTVTDVMMGKMSIDDIMETPGLDNLNIITSGTTPPNPAELLSSKSISELIKEARSEYDMVLVDAPPVLAATDAAVLGTRTDGVILVYWVGRVSRGALRRAKAQLDNVKVKVIGIVLNGLKAEISPDFADYDYYRHYPYGEEEKKQETFWDRLLSIPGFIMSFFKRISREESGEEQEGKAKKHSRLKMGVLLIALLFLVAGILYQTGFLKFPVSSKSQPRSDLVEKGSIKKEIDKDLAIAPSVKTEPMDKMTVEQPVDGQVAEQSVGDVKLTQTPDLREGTLTRPDVIKGVNNPYVIHVISDRDLGKIKEFVADLNQKGIDAHWVRADIKGKGIWYRAYIGHFADRENAIKYMKEKEIDKSYPGSLVLKTSYGQGK